MRGFESTSPEIREILGRRIDQLGLKMEGSPVEHFVLQLQDEIRRKGLKRFQAVCYLSDEWGCPDQEPIIGIPFYLADPKLAILEKEMNDLEDARAIMMYLRHEAGHAFNYAYRLYATPGGGSSSGRSTGATGSTTARSPSPAGTSGTSRGGTPRSTPTRTSPRPSPSG